MSRKVFILIIVGYEIVNLILTLTDYNNGQSERDIHKIDMFARVTFMAIYALLLLFLCFRSRSFLIKYYLILVLSAFDTYCLNYYPSCVSIRSIYNDFC